MLDDKALAATESQPTDNETLRPGLKIIRRRRWCLWIIILLYMPFMGMAMKLLPSYKAMSIAFLFWFIGMFAIALYTAVARCPRCGNFFHVHGMTLLYLRKCLHCQLHLSADKRP